MSKKKTAAQTLTNAIIDYLNGTGFYAWRNHTTGIFDKKIKGFRTIGKKGISDVLGIHKDTGRFIAIEVKIYPDTPSVFQIDFLQRINKYGGFGMIAYTLDSFLERIAKWKKTV